MKEATEKVLKALFCSLKIKNNASHSLLLKFNVYTADKLWHSKFQDITPRLTLRPFFLTANFSFFVVVFHLYGI